MLDRRKRTMAAGETDVNDNAAISAVMEWGYTREQVLSVYRQMISHTNASATATQTSSQPATSLSTVTMSQHNGDQVSYVTAASLLQAVDVVYYRSISHDTAQNLRSYSANVACASEAEANEQTHQTNTNKTGNTIDSKSEGEQQKSDNMHTVESSQQHHSQASASSHQSLHNHTTQSEGRKVDVFLKTQKVQNGLSTVQISPTVQCKDSVVLSSSPTDAAISGNEGNTQTDHESEAEKKEKESRRFRRQKLRVLKEENKKLKERQICRQCRQNPVSLTFLPCGHFCFCGECGPTFHACPLCRKTVLADVRTIVS